MAINLLDIKVIGENPSPFLSPFIFEISFECIQHLEYGKKNFLN